MPSAHVAPTSPCLAFWLLTPFSGVGDATTCFPPSLFAFGCCSVLLHLLLGFLFSIRGGAGLLLFGPLFVPIVVRPPHRESNDTFTMGQQQHVLPYIVINSDYAINFFFSSLRPPLGCNHPGA